MARLQALQGVWNTGGVIIYEIEKKREGVSIKLFSRLASGYDGGNLELAKFLWPKDKSMAEAKKKLYLS